jgi:hypothetical protein
MGAESSFCLRQRVRTLNAARRKRLEELPGLARRHCRREDVPMR